jgi:ribosome biogenesis protein MAK21
MAKSEPRRRGRSKGGDDNGVSAKLPLKTPNGNGMSSFHAPLIQWSEDESTWYEYGKDLPGRNDVLSSNSSTSPALIRRYRSMADNIYANELRLFKQSQSKTSSSDQQWVENTMRKGTLKDRIAAMSVTLSADPLHKFYALDGLMSMVGVSSTSADVGKANSRVAQLTAEALENLFVNTLLPTDRKLLTLAQRPLSQYENTGDGENANHHDAENGKKNKKKSSNDKKSLSPRILLLWRFEEMIKDKYEAYLRMYMAKTLQEGAELQKIATLRSAGNLLTSMPEGEVQLLNMMVNKLGDPEKKTAAAAGHQLRLVLQEHSNMQNIVSREVQQLAHRPHLAPKALYNCIVFLNQLQLKRAESTTPVDGEFDDNSKKQSSEPYSLPASLIKTYFRLFEVAVQQNQKKSKSKDEDGGSMKSRLLSALLTGVNRAHPYLPEKDQDMEEHVDALYRIVHTSPPAACTQALMLLFHLAVGSKIEDEQDTQNDKSQEEVGEKLRRKDRFYRALYATLAKGNIISSGKHLTMYFNLVYKAMKYDTNVNRIHSFAKRLLSAIMHAPAPLIAACAYLLQEISSTHEGLRKSWEDIPDPESSSRLVLDDNKREPKAGIVNFEDLKNDQQQKKDSIEGDAVRDSQGNPPCWEISLLAHHFHPSVSKFVNDIGSIQYGGDPLQDFGLAPFLDKFAYRNPKSREKLVQKMQQSGSGTGNRRTGKLEARLELPMNDPSFLEKTDVNEQDEFFHQFFMERARRDELKGITRNNANPDSDDDGMQDVDEDQAVDAAEEAGGLGVGGKTFEEYEAMWESDDEEEGFVDSLAMSLMEDAAGGPADIDEDPADVDDWGDLYSDESDEKENADGSDEKSNKNEKTTHQSKKSRDEDSDEDAFMEDSNADSKNDDSSNESEIEEDQIIAGLGVGAFGAGVEDEDDDSTDADGLFLSDDESDIEEAEESLEIQCSKKRKKEEKQSDQPLFVDAEEYEAMIEESFRDLKNAGQDEADKMKNDAPEPELISSKKKESKSRKKRRK